MLRNRIYNFIFIAACALPFAGMLVYTADTSAGNESAAEWPAVFLDDGSLNTLYLSEIGDYMEDHFAFRSELITANSVLRISVFGTSTDEDVIAGTDNWLYYSATLDDYQHKNNVSERTLFNAAHNIALVQDWAESLGKTFVFTIAPNKNTLYPDHMPSSSSVTYADESDLERLTDYLTAEDVNYVDMVSLFTSQDEVLYYARDSHWTETGAILAYNALLDAADVTHETYEDVEPVITVDYYGDLSEMIYPSGMYPEEYEHYLTAPSFSYITAESSGVSYLEEYRPAESAVGTGANAATDTDADAATDTDETAAGAAEADTTDVDAQTDAQTDETTTDADDETAAVNIDAENAAADSADPGSISTAAGIPAIDVEDASLLVEQDTVVTYNPEGSGSLYMFRDSFGNSLLPYMAETFESAVFSEIVPWDLTSDEVLFADVIIMEKVERHLPTLSSIAPIMAAVEQNLTFSYTSGTWICSPEEYLQSCLNSLSEDDAGEVITVDDSLLYTDSGAGSGTISFSNTIDGDYIEISGTVSEDICAVNGRIYAAVTDNSDTRVYEAFCVDTDESDYGYTLYLPGEALDGDILDVRIVVRNGSVWTCVCEYRPSAYSRAIQEAETLAEEILETYGAEDLQRAYQSYLAVQEVTQSQDGEGADTAEDADSVTSSDTGNAAAEADGNDSSIHAAGSAAEGGDAADSSTEGGDVLSSDNSNSSSEGSASGTSEQGTDAEDAVRTQEAEAEETADPSEVIVSKRYIEDCGLDTGYWDITYADGHHEYIDD